MWIKIKNAVIDLFAWLCAAVLVLLIASLTILVPSTIIVGCVKVILMMLGV